MTHEQARNNLSAHKKPGYTIQENYSKELQATTVFLISHKNRAVGAVCLHDDGDTTLAESVLESREWFSEI